jgi:hypothetical protein
METKHTPGPWKVKNSWVITEHEAEIGICHCVGNKE